ncbi:MAG: TlpA family protein disulfide reductase [Myxococcaceae bacterium]
MSGPSMDSSPPGDSAPAPNSFGRLLVTLLVGVGILGALWAGIGEARRLRPHTAGRQAPAVGFQRFGGGTLALASLHGKVVLLDFWGTFCGPCVEEMPVLVKLAQEYEHRGVAFVAPSLDDPDRALVEVGVFIDKQVPGLAPYAAIGDDASANAFGVRALPTMVIIDRSGKVVATYIGSASEREWRSRIEAALHES